MSTLREIYQQEAAALGCTLSEPACDDDCDSPWYTLLTWTNAAIDGRNYRRRSGPDVRFAFRTESGLILEVLPLFTTTPDMVARLKKHGFPDPFASLVDSNWQPEDEYELRIYGSPSSRRPIYRGEFVDWDSPIMTSGPQAVTDDALATLWRVHRDEKHAFVGMPICGCCRRALTDDVSRKLGIGPDCAKRIGLPHNHGTARAVEVQP